MDPQLSILKTCFPTVYICLTTHVTMRKEYIYSVLCYYLPTKSQRSEYLFFSWNGEVRNNCVLVRQQDSTHFIDSYVCHKTEKVFQKKKS